MSNAGINLVRSIKIAIFLLGCLLVASSCSLKIAKRWCLSVDVCFRSLDPKINEVLRTSSLNSVGAKTLARIRELSVRILVENSDVTERFANFVTFYTLNPMVFVHVTKLCDHVVSNTNPRERGHLFTLLLIHSTYFYLISTPSLL